MSLTSVVSLFLLAFVAVNAQYRQKRDIIINIQAVADCVYTNPSKTDSAECLAQIVLANKDRDPKGVELSIGFLLGNRMARNIISNQLLEFRSALAQHGISNGALDKAVQEAYPWLTPQA